MGRGTSVEIEERQGKAIVDAAIKHDVQHFVYASADRHGAKIRHGPNPRSTLRKPVPCGEALAVDGSWNPRRHDLDNSTTYHVYGELLLSAVLACVQGKGWRYAIPQDVPPQPISTVDVGWFCARVFWNRSRRNIEIQSSPLPQTSQPSTR
jgi:hypothetical protein